MGGGFTLHPTLLPQVQLGPPKVAQIVRLTFFVRSFFRFNFQLGFLLILMQLGSILGANLALCWSFFSFFCLLKTVLILKSFWERFFFDFGPSWKIENQRFVL